MFLLGICIGVALVLGVIFKTQVASFVRWTIDQFKGNKQ